MSRIIVVVFACLVVLASQHVVQPAEAGAPCNPNVRTC